MRRMIWLMVGMFVVVFGAIGTASGVGQVVQEPILTYEVMGETHLMDGMTHAELVLFDNPTEYTVGFVNGQGDAIFSLVVNEAVYRQFENQHFMVRRSTSDVTLVDILLQNRITGEVTLLLADLQLKEFFSADLSPDGRWLAVLNVAAITDGHSGSYLLNLVTGEQIRTGTSRRSRPNWSPNGQWVALNVYDASTNWTLQYTHLASGTSYHTSYLINSALWSPNGRYLFAEGFDGWTHLFEVIDMQAGIATRLEEHRAFTKWRWSPTSEHVLFVMKTEVSTDIYIYALGTNTTTFLDSAPLAVSVQDILWSSDGASIVYRTTHPENRNITLVHRINLADGRQASVGMVAHRAWQPSLLHVDALQDYGCRLTGCAD